MRIYNIVCCFQFCLLDTGMSSDFTGCRHKFLVSSEGVGVGYVPREYVIKRLCILLLHWHPEQLKVQYLLHLHLHFQDSICADITPPTTPSSSYKADIARLVMKWYERGGGGGDNLVLTPKRYLKCGMWNWKCMFAEKISCLGILLYKALSCQGSSLHWHPAPIGSIVCYSLMFSTPSGTRT